MSVFSTDVVVGGAVERDEPVYSDRHPALSNRPVHSNRHINGHETSTHNISQTNCMIRLPFTTMKSTIGSMAARIST